MSITPAEYLPCAGAMLATLDTLGLQLEAVADGDSSGLDRARTTSRELRALLRDAGIEDDYRSLRPGVVVERWPDGDVRAFNNSVFDAAFQYSTFLATRFDRTASRLEQGARSHAQAREFYRRIE